MMFDFHQVATAFNERLRLYILPLEQERAWKQAQNHSHTLARHNAYINSICLHTFLNWFTLELAEESLPQPSIYPSQDSLPSIWEVVNGAGIRLDKRRIVLIPSQTSDLEDLCVPQEWVDIPNWAADYYLAIQVNLDADEPWMEVCGFTTHRYLKNFGKYNSSDRTYILPAENLTDDLTVMQMTLELRMQEDIPKLPTLSEIDAKKFLEFFGDSSIYSPRLRVNDVTFEQWAALLVNDQWRQQLYERRIGKAVSSPKYVVDLRKWLQNLVEEAWQTYEAIFTPAEPIPVRGEIESEPISANDIPDVIRLLQPNQPEQVRLHAAAVLGEIGVRNPEAIKALIQLLRTAQDEETRWQAAISLGKLDPGNPQAGIQKARLIDIGMQLDSHQLVLVVAIMPKADGRIGVWLKVEPLWEIELPPSLKLSVLSESGETIPGLEVTARSPEPGQSYGDKLIAKRFNPPPGTSFRVKVTLNDLSVTQDFLV